MAAVDVRTGELAGRPRRPARSPPTRRFPKPPPPCALLSQAFAEVYGYEWSVRHGPPGPLETL